MFWVLDEIKDLYPSDAFFGAIFEKCSNERGFDDFHLQKGFSSNVTNFAFPSLLFANYLCKKHMEVHSWDTLDVTRHMPCSPHTTIGQR